MKFSEKEIVGGIILIVIVGAFLVNVSWATPTNVEFCGDGICSKEENGLCGLDCDWCGDSYCQDGELCGDCEDDCGSCSASSFCGDGTCGLNECDSACRKDCDFLECENGFCEIEKDENCDNSPNDCKCDGGKCDKDTGQCIYQSCGNNICDSHESHLNCPNDCKVEYTKVLIDPNKDFPIIFVHGHSSTDSKSEYSINAFEEFQEKIVLENYENKGLILPSDYPPKLTKGIWSSKKVSLLTTYYANKYDKLGGVVGPDDNQHIKIYAQRLRDVIEVVKHNTGKNKVIIIAHSMGGLVSRAYIKSGGASSVDKLVMIGTPNNGTYGLSSFGCESLFGYLGFGRVESSPECEDMKAGSDFLIELNSDDETYGNIKYLTIIGRNKKSSSCPGDGYTDNVICASSVYLNGAENYYHDDSSTEYSLSNSLHTAFIKPSKAPEVYNKIVEFINK